MGYATTSHHAAGAIDIGRIPDSSCGRHAIEDALREVLCESPGDWAVRIVPAMGSWIVAVERGGDGFHRTLLLEKHQQTPRAITRELEQALADCR